MTPEWQDTGLRANQVLVMVAAILLERAGGHVTFTLDEWNTLNDKYGGQAAVLFADKQDGSPIEAYIDTLGGTAQAAQA